MRKLATVLTYWIALLFISAMTYLWMMVVQIAFSMPLIEAALVIFVASTIMASLFLWIIIGDHQ